MTAWAVLERPQPLPAEIKAYQPKITALKAAQDQGLITPHRDPVELMAMIIALVNSWNSASWSLRALSGRPDTTTPAPEFRDHLIATVTALVTPNRPRAMIGAACQVPSGPDTNPLTCLADPRVHRYVASCEAQAAFCGQFVRLVAVLTAGWWRT